MMDNDIIGLEIAVAINQGSSRMDTEGRVYVNNEKDSIFGDTWTDSYFAASYITNLKLKIDQIELNTVSFYDNVRSMYHYTSPTIIEHQLQIQTSIYGEALAVYAPLLWNITSVSPSVSYSWDTTNQYWNVSTRYPSTYTYYNITVVIGSFKYQFGFKNAPRRIDLDLAVYYAEIPPNTGAVFVETN